MAQLRMLKGVSTALPAVSANTEGTIFYTYDDSLFHLDYKNENGELVRKTLNAEQANSLLNARTITLTGDVSGSVSFDGSQNVDIQTTISNDFVTKIDLNALETVLTGKIDDISTNIKTYNNLDQIGLSNEDMSATDFLANIKAINTALGEDDSILYLTTTNADNLHLSAVDKLSSDVNKELGYTVENNGKFVSISSPVGVCSEDGVNWVTVELPQNVYSGFLTCGNGKFVAVSNGYYSSDLIYSEDGINWMTSEVPHINTSTWGTIAYGNGKFVVVSDDGTRYGAYSEDGINWTGMTTGIIWISSIAYGNGKFVAVSKSGNGAYSEDGINWVEMQMPSDARWSYVAYGNGKFVAVAGDGNRYGAYSEDGINWVEIELPLPTDLSSSRDFSITYCKDRFFVTLRATSMGAYSEDGINWVGLELPIACNTITYGNGKFVAIGGYKRYDESTSDIAYSEDGINWTPTTLPVSGFWGNIVYGENVVKQYTSVPLSLKISRTGNTYNAITIDLIYNSGVEATYIYSCVYNKETDEADDTLSKFVITTHPKGFVSKEEVSSDAAMKLLYETGIIDPIVNSNGEILTDENGNIFVF